MHNMSIEKKSNHKEKNDEFANNEELEKQKMCDEPVRITNKEPNDENLVSKVHKRDSDEDVKSGSESYGDSAADGVTGVIQIKDSKKKKLKLLKRLSSLNAFFADTSEPVSLFSHEREQIQKEQQQNYKNRNIQGNTEQVRSDDDVVINIADDTIRKIKENAKGEQKITIPS